MDDSNDHTTTKTTVINSDIIIVVIIHNSSNNNSNIYIKLSILCHKMLGLRVLEVDQWKVLAPHL